MPKAISAEDMALLQPLCRKPPVALNLMSLNASRTCVPSYLQEAHLQSVRHYATLLATGNARTLLQSERQPPDIEQEGAPPGGPPPDIEQDPAPPGGNNNNFENNNFENNNFNNNNFKENEENENNAETTTEKPDSGGLPDIEEDPAPPATTEEATTTTEKPDSGGPPDIEEDPAPPASTEEATITTEKPDSGGPPDIEEDT